jgi:hypothetical protein
MSVDFGDISAIENEEDLSHLTINDSDFDDVMNDTTRESISVNNLDLTNDSLDLSNIEASVIDNIDETNMTSDTTKEDDLTFEGGAKKKTKHRKSKKARKNQKTRKTKKTKKNQKTRKTKKTKKNQKTRKNKRGGNVDLLGDADFNANLAFDKKAIGGTSRQSGGRNVGYNCYDPNYSIYNTRSLQLFPYKP